MESRPGDRIVLIGSSNAGKSTLGAKLAEARAVPFIELDALNWEPNWTPAERDVFRERIRRAIQPDAWVMAGNYTSHMDISWKAADTIVWLDLPLQLVLRRCVLRTWRRWRTREVLWGTNVEDFKEHLAFWNPNKSLLTYTILNHRKRKRNYSGYMTDPAWSHLTFIRLRSVDEIDIWMRNTATNHPRVSTIHADESPARTTA